MRSSLATNRSFSPVTQIRPVPNFLCGLLRPPETSLLRIWEARERLLLAPVTPSFGVLRMRLTIIRTLESR
jgi:hypothetical protein